MVFRTGSILIVGHCNEKQLVVIYDYLKKILIKEYNNIYQKTDNDNNNKDKKEVKVRKKTIHIPI